MKKQRKAQIKLINTMENKMCVSGGKNNEKIMNIIGIISKDFRYHMLDTEYYQ